MPTHSYPSTPPANFDRVARAYRWLEYFSFGPLLKRCRFHSIPALLDIQHGLVLGDGDGRFTARLIASNPSVIVEVIDSSREMLRLLQRRTRSPRVHTYLADARILTPPGRDFDGVATHFFLDCLSQADMDALAFRISQYLRPGALWVISEFNVPARGIFRPPSRVIIGSLYLAFRVLTGLRIRKVPDYASALQTAGFKRVQQQAFLGSLLVSEIWQWHPQTEAT